MPSRPPIHRPVGWRPAPRKDPSVQDPYYGTADWKRRREAALERDGHRCTWIEDGERCAERAVVVDHRVPRRKGGSDDLPNLRSLCRRHDNRRHREKGGRVE